MRFFVRDSGSFRKIVGIEVEGCQVNILESQASGEFKKVGKQAGSETHAGALSERMAGELLARGFMEQGATPAAKPVSPATVAATRRPPVRDSSNGRAPAAPPARPAPERSQAAVIKAPQPEPEPVATPFADLFEDVDPAPPRVLPPAPLPRRNAPLVERDPERNPPRAGTFAPGRNPKRGNDGLDKRVILGVMSLGLGFVAAAGLFIYESFLKPPSIHGIWSGSKLDYEFGKPITKVRYDLVLDAQNRFSMTLQGSVKFSGTYTYKGDRLSLAMSDNRPNPAPKPVAGPRLDADPNAEPSPDAVADATVAGDAEPEPDADIYDEPSNFEYKVALGRATMDLFDPSTGNKVVQLLRQDPKYVAAQNRPAPAAPGAPVGVAAAGDNAAPGAGLPAPDAAADARLASEAYGPSDGAFRLRYPAGWTATTGARPDNTYSWTKFVRGSATIKASADVTGSLISGSDLHFGPDDQGTAAAPVHQAHEAGARSASEEFKEFAESAPAVFPGSGLGEGRIAEFTAAGGGLFGGKLRGYRITLLTNDRRVTILCWCPEGDFKKLQPTFLAVGRSLNR